MEKLHHRYGTIVRIAPNELSFSSAQSFKDIYGAPSKSKKLFLKSELFYEQGEHLNIAHEHDPAKYAMKRKMFNPSFSARALRDQEHVIHEHVELFLKQIERLGSGPDGINLTEALEWLTFDIMGMHYSIGHTSHLSPAHYTNDELMIQGSLHLASPSMQYAKASRTIGFQFSWLLSTVAV